MIKKIKLALSREDVKELEKQFRSELGNLKDEMDDHLDAINQNTNEIQANYEYLCRLDGKISKLNERIDELFMLFKHNTGEAEPVYEVHSLTKREKEVFLTLYALEEEVENVSYEILAKRLGMTTELVQAYVANLVEKGVPILKRYAQNQAFIRIDPVFKTVQAKKNLLEINEAISEKVISYK